MARDVWKLQTPKPGGVAGAQLVPTAAVRCCARRPLPACGGTSLATGTLHTHQRMNGSVLLQVTPMAPWQAAGSISSKSSTRVMRDC